MYFISSSASPMSSLCLSSVLTGANLAMYQTAISDVVPQQQASINTQHISNTAYSSNPAGETQGSALCLCE